MQGTTSTGSSAAISSARGKPKAEALARLVADVLFRQAEKKTPFGSPEHLAARVREAGLERVDADTPFGNVLGALERGPEGPAETQIVEAFLGIGILERLTAQTPQERGTRAAGLLDSLDWLTAWTPFDAYAAADGALAASGALAFWEAAVAELSAGTAPTRTALAHRLLRVEALRASSLPEREVLLARASQTAADTGVRRVAGGEVATPLTHVPQITGRYGGRPPTPLRRLVALATGFAAVAGLFGFLARLLLGLRRTVTVSLVHRGVRIERRVDLLGRTVRRGEEVIPFGSLALVARETRFPYLYLLVGVLGMVVGATWGVFRLVEGIRHAYAALALVGLGAVAVGVGFDLALFSFWPWRRGRTALHLLQKPRKWLRVLDVPEADAHALLTAVGDRLRAG